MKKTLSITTVVLLVFAIISVFLIYRQYTGARDKLLNCETNLADLNEKVSQLNQENTVLQEKAEAAVLVEQLKSRHEVALSKLSQEMQSYDESLSALHEKLSVKTAHARELEEELLKVQSEIEILRQELTALTDENRTSEGRLAKAEQEKAEAAVLVEQLKSRHEAALSKLSQEIQSRDERISVLLEQKGRAEGKLVQVESSCDVRVSRMDQELGNKDVRIAEIEKNLMAVASRAETLKKDVETRERRIEFLEQRISNLFGEKEMLKTRIGQLESTHKSMVTEFQGQMAKKEVTIHELEDKLTITFVDRILFDFGMATISSEGKEILTRVGNILKNVKDRKIRVIGHTDNVPIMEGYRYKFPSNWELSSARAAAVVRLFQNEIGLEPETLEAVGRSFHDPIATNETKEGRAQNRRVNIIIAHGEE